MSDEGFAALAAQSAKVRNEHRLLLEGLRSFERRLLDLVSGIRCQAESDIFTFEEFIDSEGEVNGIIQGYLFFDGKELAIGSKEEPSPSWDPAYWSVCSLVKAGVEWQRKVSDQKVLDSLVANLLVNLNAEYDKTAPVVQSLAQFTTIEKAEIDSDLDELFSGNATLLESWMKARKAVQTDPEQSITLSCSHVETVLKGCLKSLNATEYETLPIEKLARKTLGLLKADNAIDTVTAEMVQGAITMSKSIGETRNFKSSSHGKNEGYVPPSSDLAQLANHLAGVVSVFVMKQTDRVTKAR